MNIALERFFDYFTSDDFYKLPSNFVIKNTHASMNIDMILHKFSKGVVEATPMISKKGLSSKEIYSSKNVYILAEDFIRILFEAKSA